MRRPRINLDAVAEEMGARRSLPAPLVKRVALPDRHLVRIGPESHTWKRVNEDDGVPYVEPGSIVWVKPPPGVEAPALARFLKQLKRPGADIHVKLLSPDRVDDVVVEERVERAPELGAEQTREVVYQLCRELADQAGVPRETVIEQVEPYLAVVGL